MNEIDVFNIAMDEFREILSRHERKSVELADRVELIEQGRDPNLANPSEWPTLEEFYKSKEFKA